MKRHLLLLSVTISLLVSSCSSGSESIFSEISGKEGEIVVCWKPELWSSPINDTLESILAKDMRGLPQYGTRNAEKCYKLMNLDPIGFGNVFKKHRNIVKVNFLKSYEKNIVFIKNAWAKPQFVIQINVSNSKELMATLTKNKVKIFNFFWNNELKRIDDQYKQVMSKNTLNKISEKYNLAIDLPRIYQKSITKEGFDWYQYISPGHSQQHLYIFSFEYTDAKTFTKDFLLNKLDSIFKYNVEGPDKGSHMAIERDFAVDFNEFKTKNSKYIAELRGLWKLDKGFMGGPFVSHSILDKKNNKVITVCSSVFAPQSKKRNLVRQLDAILLSMKIIQKKKND